HADRSVEIFFTEIGHGSDRLVRSRSIIERVIQSAKLFNRSDDDSFDVFGFQAIGGNENRMAAGTLDLVHRFESWLLSSSGNGNGSAFSGKCDRTGFADSGTPTGDDRNLV